MESDELITLEELCRHYPVEVSFITLLSDYGLIELVQIETNRFIRVSQLGEFERLMRLHYDLEINMAGIDVITHLLEKVKHLQAQVNAFKSQIEGPEADQ